MFTGSINRMELLLYRERNAGTQGTGQIAGYLQPHAHALIVMFCVSCCLPPPLPYFMDPPVPIKTNCTETIACWAYIGFHLRCGCSLRMKAQ